MRHLRFISDRFWLVSIAKSDGVIYSNEIDSDIQVSRSVSLLLLETRSSDFSCYSKNPLEKPFFREEISLFSVFKWNTSLKLERKCKFMNEFEEFFFSSSITDIPKVTLFHRHSFVRISTHLWNSFYILGIISCSSSDEKHHKRHTRCGEQRIINKYAPIRHTITHTRTTSS